MEVTRDLVHLEEAEEVAALVDLGKARGVEEDLAREVRGDAREVQGSCRGDMARRAGSRRTWLGLG